MNLVTQNVRGINKSYKHREFNVFWGKNNVGLVVVSEYKVIGNNVARVIAKLGRK